MKAKNKTIIVTGAGSGIGRELSLQLLQKGSNVVGIDINNEALAETQKIANVDDSRFKYFKLDITDNAKVYDILSKAINHFGTIDGIINNAGIIQKFIPINELSIEDINRVMNVNFYGTVYMTKALLPHLLKLPEAHVVNVSSMGGFIPFPTQTIYGAAKAAVKIFTEGLHIELKNTAVNVTVVHPGAVRTNITLNSGMKQPQIDVETTPKKGTGLSPSKAASIIIRAMERNKYRVTVGKDAAILDLLYRVNPRFASNFIGKMMKKNLKHIEN